MDEFWLPERLRAAIVEHACAGLPNEVCGLVVGRDGVAVAVHRGRNVATTPRVSFDMAVETLALQATFEDDGLSLVAIYHSHPAGPARLSVLDISRATYPDALMIVCGLGDPAHPVLRAYRMLNASAQEVPIRSQRIRPAALGISWRQQCG